MKLFFVVLCGISMMGSFARANTEIGFCKDCFQSYNCGCSDNCGCEPKESRCTTDCPCCNGSDRGKE